jgi:hypothetical protein
MDIPTASGRAPAVWSMDEVLEIAARLAGSDAVAGIHVAFGERPTYDAILHYRRLAEASGLALIVEADAIVLRPHGFAGRDFADRARPRSDSVWAEIRKAARLAWLMLRPHFETTDTRKGSTTGRPDRAGRRGN